MFVFLRYADNKQLIVNINCATRILLNYIRTTCLPETASSKFKGEIDLCDTKGQLIHLSARPPMSMAAEKLEERGTYIPVLITVTEDAGVISNVEPLLIDVNKHFPEYKLTTKNITEEQEKNSKNKK